jgi:hypothetical protein
LNSQFDSVTAAAGKIPAIPVFPFSSVLHSFEKPYFSERKEEDLKNSKLLPDHGIKALYHRYVRMGKCKP